MHTTTEPMSFSYLASSERLTIQLWLLTQSSKYCNLLIAIQIQKPNYPKVEIRSDGWKETIHNDIISRSCHDKGTLYTTRCKSPLFYWLMQNQQCKLTLMLRHRGASPKSQVAVFSSLKQVSGF